uniref:Thionin-like protein 2 n=1 Tax=Cajanus cajan TaxID=3821 RepID=A0A151RWG3_CAJCA|nr:hypothetical protein KK1_031525 [Cajanus cajan]
MTKKEMKTTGIVIIMMIMLGIVQASDNLQDVKIEPNNRFGVLNYCSALCNVECGILIFNKRKFKRCYDKCSSGCRIMSNDVVHNCITRCGLTKSIDNNIDARDLTTFVMDSCLKDCQRKQ